MDAADYRARARASGLSARLKDFFREAADAWQEEPRRYIGPRNANQLATWLSRDCREPVSAETVRNWIKYDNLPESRFVAHLETLLGAPWVYIDRRKAKITEEERAVFRLLYLATPKEAARFVAAVRAALPHA